MLIRIALASALPSPNRTNHRHWSVAAKRRKALAWEVKIALLGQVLPAEPIRFAYVRVERHALRGLDKDNRYAAVKLLLDVLQPFGPHRPLGLGIIAGDDDKRLNLTVVNVLISRKMLAKTVVIISDLPLTEAA